MIARATLATATGTNDVGHKPRWDSPIRSMVGAVVSKETMTDRAMPHAGAPRKEIKRHEMVKPFDEAPAVDSRVVRAVEDDPHT